MSQVQNAEALSVVASTIDETHDGLARFTSKLQSIEELPSFWWKDFPIWMNRLPVAGASVWPIVLFENGKIGVRSPNGNQQFHFETEVFANHAREQMDVPLSNAEFALFQDLAAGISLEISAQKAGVALSTRRKQLQNCFRKLSVSSQGELVSLANQLVFSLSHSLTRQSGQENGEWSEYLPFLPAGARCGVIEVPDRRSVRYLEIGPPTGKPVIILHPMMFPHISAEDVALCQELDLRLLWPLRSGCLSHGSQNHKDWATHCTDTVQDLRTIHEQLIGRPVPIIALVSSGAYATRFAEKFKESVLRVDFVSTCFSAGKSKTRDVYFGDFLLRKLRQNARLAVVFIQHLSENVFAQDQFERSLRRIFRGSAMDQQILDEDFSSTERRERVKFAIRYSIESMRLDYLSQLHFCWTSVRRLKVPTHFWHGSQDTVHNPEHLSQLSISVSDAAPSLIANMGHLTQGRPLREAIRRISVTYSE